MVKIVLSVQKKNDSFFLSERGSEGLRFDSSRWIRKFSSSHARDKKKKSIFLYFLTEIKAFYLSYFIFSSVTKLSNTKHTGNAFQQIYRFSLREIYHITSIIRNSSPKVCWSLDETGSQIFQNSPLLLSVKRLLGQLFLLIWMGISPFKTPPSPSSISSGFPWKFACTHIHS